MERMTTGYMSAGKPGKRLAYESLRIPYCEGITALASSYGMGRTAIVPLARPVMLPGYIEAMGFVGHWMMVGRIGSSGNRLERDGGRQEEDDARLIVGIWTMIWRMTTDSEAREVALDKSKIKRPLLYNFGFTRRLGRICKGWLGNCNTCSVVANEILRYSSQWIAMTISQTALDAAAVGLVPSAAPSLRLSQSDTASSFSGIVGSVRKTQTSKSREWMNKDNKETRYTFSSLWDEK
jgi:hypothetical protein